MNPLAVNARDLAAHFAAYWWLLAVWATPLVVLCIAGIRRAGPLRSGDLPPREASSRSMAPADWLGVATLAAFLVVVAYLVLYHEDLVGLDYAQLTARRFVAIPIWPESGRFFPLGLQEYNVISLFGRSAPLYHGFALLELVAALACVFRILDAPVWFRCLVMIFMMALPSFVESFFGLVYPERDMILWLVVWIICLRSFDRTGAAAAFCGAMIAAQFLLYYKETAFILVGGVAGLRLLLAGWRSADLRRGRISDFAMRRSLEIGHLILCAVFLLVYYTVVARHVRQSYVAGSASSAAIATAMSYVRSDLLFDALLAAIAWRTAWLVAKKRAPDLLWDPLAAAAFAYAVAYIKLGLVREYYLAPADVIAVLYLAHFGYGALRAQRRVALAGTAVVAALVFGRNVSRSANGILDRKEFVDANVHLASFLTSYSRANREGDLTLFLPQTAGFQAMEFSAFLQYKGLRPAGVATPPGSTFTVKSAHRYPDDYCHPSQSFRCVYDPAPQRGELAVFLPGRDVSPTDLQAARAAGAEEVFHYRLAPTSVERALRSLAPADRVDPPVEAYVFKY